MTDTDRALPAPSAHGEPDTFTITRPGARYTVRTGWFTETMPDGARLLYRVAPDTVQLTSDAGDTWPIVYAVNAPAWATAVDNGLTFVARLAEHPAPPHTIAT